MNHGMKRTKWAALFAAALASAAVFAGAGEVSLDGVPKPPPPEKWAFREELAKPRANSYTVVPEGKKPWIENRITRCFFGPIKRAPYYRDELMDDVDYYPDAYLDRLAKEGVNGLWLTVEFDDLVETSFNRRSPDAARRLAKLRRTVDKCLKYGIKTWVFAIEPRTVSTNSWAYIEHRDWVRKGTWGNHYVMCPSVPGVQQYLYEAMKDLFTQVPRLGGYLGITNGERPTTCLSSCAVTEPFSPKCELCAARRPHEVHNDYVGSMAKGMLEANPEARLISWFYHPQPDPYRDAWVVDCAANLPEGVVFQYNFESGALREQCRRWHLGGDYWLSFVGPANGFRAVAEAAQRGGSPLSAKLQVGNSHECATVPFVPVPGLLYRKYREMRKLGVTSVMQCWYFGNYPGLMNEAAGALAYEDFQDGEEAFLMRLARPGWGDDAKVVANLWTRYSDAYSHYPLVNEMQYYGPFHAGVVWPLLPDITMQNLGRTWKPEEPPSGDVIGEALLGFSLDDALELASEMSEGVKSKTEGVDTLDWLAARHAGDAERLQDIGVMRTLENLFESARDIFEFYRLRSEAIWRSRCLRDGATAARCVRRMIAVARNERAVSERQIGLCEGDSRLGFHSEAEAHQFHPEYLRWRIARLDEAVSRMETILGVLESGETYPLSKFESGAESARVGGGWVAGKGADSAMRWRIDQAENGDLEIRGEGCRRKALRLYYWDLCTTHFQSYVDAGVSPDGKFEAKIRAASWGNDDRLKPRWFLIRLAGSSHSLWPGVMNWNYRLKLGSLQGNVFGRLLYDGEAN